MVPVPVFECLPEALPVFMQVETTGVKPQDAISALFLLPMGYEKPIMALLPMAPALQDKAKQYLQLERYESYPKLRHEGMRELIKRVATRAGKPLLLVTYNTEFQHRFLAQSQLFEGVSAGHLIREMLDLPRLAQACSDATTCPIFGQNVYQTLLSWIEASTVGKRHKYTTVLQELGIPIPSKPLPWEKPVYLRCLFTWLLDALARLGSGPSGDLNEAIGKKFNPVAIMTSAEHNDLYAQYSIVPAAHA